MISAVLLLALAQAPLEATPRGAPALPAPRPPEVIVLLRPGVAVDRLLAEHPGVELVRRFEALPGFVARGRAEALAHLAVDPRVAAQQPDAFGHALTEEAATLTGARAVARTLGLTGRGVRVAVLDTGVDRAHPDLDGGLYAEKCFVLGGCPPGDTDTGDLAPDTSGHGTHVVGIVTGDGRVAPRGVAPDSEVLVVRVFNQQLVGRVSDWVAALDWVLANHEAWGVRVVNLSLGTDVAWPGDCDDDQPALADVVARLRAAGVAVFAASGNEAHADGMTAPACVGGVLSVGAVYDVDLGREPDTGTYSSGCVDAKADAGAVACFSNVSAGLDLLAPGSRIRSCGAGGGVSERRGTSQASPHAAAIAALLLELDPLLSVDALERILEETGRPTPDARRPLPVPLVQVEAAVAEVQRTQCTRRPEGASCELARTCADDADGGIDAGADAGPRCEVLLGTCVAEACVLASPAWTGTLPGAGCSSAAGGALLLLALALAGRRRPPS